MGIYIPINVRLTHLTNNWSIPALKGNNMSENDNETIDSTNDDEAATDDSAKDSTDDASTESTDDSSSDDSKDDSSDDDSEELEKLKGQNVKLFERAKKAEGFIKDEDGGWVKKPKPAPKAKPETKEAQKIEITPMDTIALMEAEVTNTDDINEVLDYARFKNISVAKALKSSLVKTTIADRVAERKTAEATATKGGKKGISTPDADTLVQQANEGNFPDDPADLAKARMDQKKGKKS